MGVNGKPDTYALLAKREQKPRFDSGHLHLGLGKRLPQGRSFLLSPTCLPNPLTTKGVEMRKCAYCGFGSKDNREFRKMPNKLFACEDCYKEKNPLFTFGQHQLVWKNRKRLREQDRKNVEEQGAPPSMHNVYSHPLIKLAYDMLKKNKKFDIPNLEGR